jgi:hypothetical protein
VALARRSNKPIPSGVHLEKSDDNITRELLRVAPDLIATDQLAASLTSLLDGLRSQSADAVAGSRILGT